MNNVWGTHGSNIKPQLIKIELNLAAIFQNIGHSLIHTKPKGFCSHNAALRTTVTCSTLFSVPFPNPTMIRLTLSLLVRTACLGVAAVTFAVPARAELGKKEGNPANDPAWVKKAAMEIDKRLGAGFAKAAVKPQPAADDSRWMRRLYLDATGRIPTYEEAKAFLDDTAPDKREKLINQLLASEGYVGHMYNYFCDLLRATSNLGTDGTRSGVPYLRWIRESVANNKPFDKLTYELLTTNGGGWEPGKGAVGYFERDRGMPLDNMANTTRIFLGTHIECAQCHDHPYDKWKQLDFYEMSAFTHGLQVGNRDERAKHANEKYNGKSAEEDRARRDLYRWLNDNIYDFGVKGQGDGQIKLPMDFNGKGGKPYDVVKARSVFPGASSGRREGDDARGKFAKWVTEKDNPRFTMLIANRMWKKVMGIGLFEPVDKYAEPSKDNPTGTLVSNPDVLAYLQTMMKDLDYDLKAFQKVLFSTRGYALGTNPNAVDTRMPYAFHGRAVRRMTAEQVWDSMAALVVPDIDYRKGNALNPTARVYGKNLGQNAYEIYTELATKDIKAMDAWVDRVAKEMGKGKQDDNMMMDTSMMAESDAKTSNIDPSKWAKYNKSLYRASELSSPTPPDHFLRKFGQSSREVIEGASADSDVTQVLSLINGHVEKTIIGDSDAILYKAIDAAASPEAKVKAAFITILSRNPTPAEIDLMLPEAKNGRDGIKNIIYALLNSNEFIFIL
jgi:Protein of unknown function (DUF1549)/Protein of unknown function (DUF1553)